MIIVGWRLSRFPFSAMARVGKVARVYRIGISGLGAIAHYKGNVIASQPNFAAYGLTASLLN